MKRDDGVVVLFNGTTTLPTPPDQVLEQAVGAGLTEVLVLGWDEAGELDVRSSTSDGREVLWLIEKARRWVLEQL